MPLVLTEGEETAGSGSANAEPAMEAAPARQKVAPAGTPIVAGRIKLSENRWVCIQTPIEITRAELDRIQKWLS